jgi:uncharacterized membrane protein
MPKWAVFGLVTFLHDLFSVVWIGGLVTLGLIVIPVARAALGKGPQMKALLQGIRRRLSVFVYVSMIGLLVTGILLSRRSPAFQGLFAMGNPYALVLGIKHILVVAMVVIALLRSIILAKVRGLAAPVRERVDIALLYVNMLLGIIVLALSGFVAALGAAPLAG